MTNSQDKNKCRCPIKNLLTSGHSPECPESPKSDNTKVKVKVEAKGSRTVRVSKMTVKINGEEIVGIPVDGTVTYTGIR